MSIVIDGSIYAYLNYFNLGDTYVMYCVCLLHGWLGAVDMHVVHFVIVLQEYLHTFFNTNTLIRSIVSKEKVPRL
jgi:hypothetical protein